MTEDQYLNILVSFEPVFEQTAELTIYKPPRSLSLQVDGSERVQRWTVSNLFPYTYGVRDSAIRNHHSSF